MSSLYSLTQTDQGYAFVTDQNIEYQIFFTIYYLDDEDGNEHRRGTATYQKKNLYGGILVKKENPLKSLLINAFEKHINDQFG